MRVLVVEDDSKIASFVVNGLKQNGFAADLASDGEIGLALAHTVTYDAAILDIMLQARWSLVAAPVAAGQNPHAGAHTQREGQGG